MKAEYDSGTTKSSCLNNRKRSVLPQEKQGLPRALGGLDGPDGPDQPHLGSLLTSPTGPLKLGPGAPVPS